MAQAASPSSRLTGWIAPLAISAAKVLDRTRQAFSASSPLTPMEMPVSEADQENVDVLVRQGGEDAPVDADDAHHRGGGKGDQGDVVDGGDALDDPFGGFGVLLVPDERAGGFGVEGVLDEDGDPLEADGVHGRRIDDLRAEVAQFHRLFVGQFVDDVRGPDDAGVGGHEPVHIRPYLQDGCVQGGRENAGRVVRPAPAEGGDVPGAVPGDEAGDDGHGTAFPIAPEALGNQLVRGFEVHVPAVRPDEVQRIVQRGVPDGGRDDPRGEAFAEAQDLGAGLVGQDLEQEDAPADALEFIQQGIDRPAQRAAGLRVPHEVRAGVDVALPEGPDVFLVGAVRRLGQGRDADQFVGHPAEGGDDDDGRFFLGGDDGFDPPDVVGGGDGTAAEFHDFHLQRLGLNSRTGKVK